MKLSDYDRSRLETGGITVIERDGKIIAKRNDTEADITDLAELRTECHFGMTDIEMAMAARLAGEPNGHLSPTKVAKILDDERQFKALPQDVQIAIDALQGIKANSWQMLDAAGASPALAHDLQQLKEWVHSLLKNKLSRSNLKQHFLIYHKAYYAHKTLWEGRTTAIARQEK